MAKPTPVEEFQRTDTGFPPTPVQDFKRTED
jgi:hypothetical protein